MFERVIRWLYQRAGSRYWLVMIAGQAGVSIFVVLLTVAVIASYYTSTAADYLWIAIPGCGLTVLAVMWATLKAMPAYNAIVNWRATEAPTPEETVNAWEAATTLTFRQYRSSSGWVNSIVVFPTCALSVVLLDLDWWPEFFVMVLATLIPAIYATVLSYSVGEMLSRPLVSDIADVLPDDFPFERHGLPVAKRIRVGLPTYTAATGLVVAALVGSRNGSDDLVLAVVVALAVGLALSHELSVLLSEGITAPIGRVRTALSRVQGGDLTARVPVTTSDELGELAHDFNLMALRSPGARADA